MTNRNTSETSITVLFRQYMLAVLVLFSLILSGCWIYLEYRNFKAESEQIEREFLQQQKSLIKGEVERALEYIHFHKNRVEIQLRESIRLRVREAHALATKLIAEHAPTSSVAELEEIVRETIRPIRYYNSSGYLFALSTNGVEQLLINRVEGASLSNSQQADNTEKQSISGTLIEIATTHQEGYYQYNWSKPGHAGDSHPKISFVKYLAPLNWIIGTGSYLEDADQAVKREVIEWIRSAKLAEDSYVFLMNADGKIISHDEDTLTAAGKMPFADKNNIQIAKGIMNAAKTGEGFFSYQWQHPELGSSHEKLTYSHYFAKWDWIISAGVYVEELTRLVEQRKEKHRELILQQILLIIVLRPLHEELISILFCLR